MCVHNSVGLMQDPVDLHVTAAPSGLNTHVER